jgi:hypothetical protein
MKQQLSRSALVFCFVLFVFSVVLSHVLVMFEAVVNE